MLWLIRCCTAWNFGCAFAQNEGELLAFRFLSGFGGNGLLAVSYYRPQLVVG